MKTVKLIIAMLVMGLVWHQPSIAQGETGGSSMDKGAVGQNSENGANVSQGDEEYSDEGSEYLSPDDEAGPIDQPPPPKNKDSSITGFSDTQPPADQPAEGGAVEYFRDKLAPYGDWTWTNEFGWVWSPRGVASDWRPYTYGQWVYTEYGWTWSSYYPWGWAPFHYGRWAYLGANWVWVPGTRWAPAWVMWRYSDGYVGWSPLLAGFDLWYGWSYYPVHYDQWTFVAWNRFHDPHPYHHFVPRHQMQDVFRHTYYPKNCRHGSGPFCQRGPARTYAERHISSPIVVTRVNNIHTRGHSGREVSGLGIHGERLNIYRPRVPHSSASHVRQPHRDNPQRVPPSTVDSGRRRDSFRSHTNESDRGVDRGRQFDRPVGDRPLYDRSSTNRTTFKNPSTDRPAIYREATDRSSINRPAARPRESSLERHPRPGQNIYSRPQRGYAPTIRPTPDMRSAPSIPQPTMHSAPSPHLRSMPSTRPSTIRSAPTMPAPSGVKNHSNSSHSRHK